VNQLNLRAERGKSVARAFQRPWIAVESDDSRRSGLEQRSRMPPEAHRAVDENSAALWREVLEHLGNHHRRVNYLAIGVHVELRTTNQPTTN